MNKQQQRRRHNRSGGARSCYASRVTREVLARIFIRAISSVPHGGHPLPFASRDVGEVRRPPESGRERPNTRAQHNETKRLGHTSTLADEKLWTRFTRPVDSPQAPRWGKRFSCAQLSPIGLSNAHVEDSAIAGPASGPNVPVKAVNVLMNVPSPGPVATS